MPVIPGIPWLSTQTRHSLSVLIAIREFHAYQSLLSLYHGGHLGIPLVTNNPGIPDISAITFIPDILVIPGIPGIPGITFIQDILVTS